MTPEGKNSFQLSLRIDGKKEGLITKRILSIWNKRVDGIEEFLGAKKEGLGTNRNV